ncbi:MAG: hypothetical protein HUJ67_01960, partial [Ruminiclostridium sp.]|nr:hypothetical protein [Ruminiclostridium sp.]
MNYIIAERGGERNGERKKESERGEMWITSGALLIFEEAFHDRTKKCGKIGKAKKKGLTFEGVGGNITKLSR